MLEWIETIVPWIGQKKNARQEEFAKNAKNTVWNALRKKAKSCTIQESKSTGKNDSV